MDRRSFVTGCTLSAAVLAAAPSLILPASAAARPYPKVLLLGEGGRPLRAADVDSGAPYVFHYPYASTPCFLLDLGRAVPAQNGLKTEGGAHYDWPGGTGPARSLVAFSAICAHQMAHPTRAVSYIGFRAPRDADDPVSGVISCCAENSRYDPFAGAAVLSGPAAQPLAAILLEHDVSKDELYAIGTLGGEMFQRFFAEFEARLMLENPGSELRSPLSGSVPVQRLEAFSANVVAC